MSEPEEELGRYRQRRRTRAGIVAAAAELLEQGRTPSVSEVAAAADVSRRTVYLYFPTLEQLLLDATLGRLSERAVDEAFAAVPTSGEPVTQTQQMLATLAAETAETLPLGRSLIRLTVEASEKDTTPGPRRGYRRVRWVEQALAPLRPRLTAEAYDRLVSGLVLVIGWEALVVLEDVRALTGVAQRGTVLWAARALVTAALAESEGSGPEPEA